MKLYYSKGACSLVVRIVLHEMNIAFEFESVDLETKQTETGSDFLKINAKGEVPTLMLDNTEILTENAVILQYLADVNKATLLLPPVGDFKRYRVLEWLNFITTDIHKGFGPLFNPQVAEAAKEEIFIPILKNKFKLVDQHLSQNKYLLGDQFTLPDAYIYVMLFWCNIFKIRLSQWQNVAHYFADLTQRTSIRQALKDEGLLR